MLKNVIKNASNLLINFFSVRSEFLMKVECEFGFNQKFGATASEFYKSAA